MEGRRVGDIGNAVQTHAENRGYSVVREMVGHGLGRHMHEAPEVPNYGRRGTGPKLKKGMVICIEPMTGVTNAVNLHHAGKYSGLQTVPAGGEWSGSFWIRAVGF